MSQNANLFYHEWHELCRESPEYKITEKRRLRTLCQRFPKECQNPWEMARYADYVTVQVYSDRNTEEDRQEFDNTLQSIFLYSKENATPSTYANFAHASLCRNTMDNYRQLFEQ